MPSPVKNAAYYLTQSIKPTIVGVDSKSVYQGFNLLKAGKFSAATRMHSFLQCINRFPIIVQHITGKFKANIPADYLSRNPVTCNNPEECQLCKFVEEKSQALLCTMNTPQSSSQNKDINIVSFQGKNESNIIAATNINELEKETAPHPFANCAAWCKLQQEDASCSVAIEHVATSQPLPRRSKDKDERNYFNHASLSKPDNLLVVRENVPFHLQHKERIYTICDRSIT